MVSPMNRGSCGLSLMEVVQEGHSLTLSMVEKVEQYMVTAPG